jgi:protein phosphatase
MSTVRSGSASDIGLLRQVNEDSLLASGGIFAVADGMGGYAAGEVASALAVDRLRRLSEGVDFKPDDLRAEIALANSDILASAGEHPERKGMGTTVAGVGVIRIAGTDHWVVFNVGDSRVYRFVDDALVQVTVDHSEIAELVASGEVAAADADTHPRRHVVTRALGSDPAPEPDVWVFPPTAGERFVICSDGLCLELADIEIAEVLRGQSTPQQAADELVRRAVAAGGRDNVTVVVVDRGGDADATFADTVPRRATEVPVA